MVANKSLVNLSIHENQLLSLIKLALGYSIDSTLSDNSINWDVLFQIASEQSVIGVTFAGIERLPKEKVPEMDLLMEWCGQNEFINSTNNALKQTAFQVSSLFRDNGIRVKVLKGLALLENYPENAPRLLGDFDCYLLTEGDNSKYSHKKAFKKANGLIKKEGIAINSRHIKHSVFEYSNLSIENHLYCTDFYADKYKRSLEALFQQMLIEEDCNFVEGSFIECPNDTFNALYFITHAFHHFLNEGLTLRHFCDWATLIREKQDFINWSFFYDWVDKTDMRIFADSMNGVVSEYLGLTLYSKEIHIDNRFTNRILQDTFSRKHTGLSGWRYTRERFKKMSSSGWKYKYIYKRNMPIEILKEYMGYCFFNTAYQLGIY